MRKILLATVAALCMSTAAYAEDITGAGSTFAAPLYGKWAEAGKPTTGVSLNYQAIGSGAGINQINNRTVDFGASDMPLSGDKLQEHNLFQFPTAVGAVVIIVNIPGIETNTLKLTGEMLADIYLGKISKWNDPALVALNPRLKDSNFAIAPIYRADGSGTTFVFTDYLGMQNATWKSTVGASTSVSWKAGTGAKGNDGVSATVHAVKGGIGYVESAFATMNHLTTTQLKNHDGNFVSPTMDTFKASAASADWSTVKNYAIDLNNQPGVNSWPIESATFVLLPNDAPHGKAVKTFFAWAFAGGDSIALGLNYVPLPTTVTNELRSKWGNEP